MRLTTMETFRGSFLLFLIILMFSAYIVAQTDPTTETETSTSSQTDTTGTSSIESTSTPAPNSSSDSTSSSSTDPTTTGDSSGKPPMSSTTPNTLTNTTDINECLLDVNICNDELKMCSNSPCFRGLVGHDTCFRAPYAFVGVLDLAYSDNQTWSLNLTDKKSKEFKDLSGKVARSILNALIDGHVGTNNTLYVEVLFFKEDCHNITENNKTQCENTTMNNITTEFVIYTSNGSVTADILDLSLREYNASDCITVCHFREINVSSSVPTVNRTADLCSYPQIHKCDTSTSFCTQLNQTTCCDCKMGFAYSTESLSCRDIDECAGNNSETCPETGMCMNTFGSYECECNATDIWDIRTTQCVPDVCSTTPCQNGGICFVLMHNHSAVACKCTYGWDGPVCADDDVDAKRMKVALICTTVILGLICVIALIALKICKQDKVSGK